MATMKFRVYPDGFMFPARPEEKAGKSTKAGGRVLEVLEVPNGESFLSMEYRLSMTRIPDSVSRIRFRQTGRDLFSEQEWPDRRWAPKPLRDSWRSRS